MSPSSSPSSSSSSALTAEQKNATMKEERAFLTKLLESALHNEFSVLKQHVESYRPPHHHHDNDHDHDTNQISYIDILTQFRDGQRRTALHFACQSSSARKKNVTKQQNNSNHHNTNGSSSSQKEDKDIVEEMLDWLSSQQQKQQQKQQQQQQQQQNDTTTTNTTINDNDEKDQNTSTLETLLCAKDKNGLTPIMLAAQVKDNPALAERRVCALLRCASSKKLGLARSKAGATALHYAAGAGATRTTLQALYDNAGPIALSACSKQGGTPLHWAVAVPPPAQYFETIQALLDCGADPQQCQPPLSSSSSVSSSSVWIPPPLHMAVAAGNVPHAQLLLDEMIQRNVNLQPTLEYVLPNHNGSSIFHMLADMNLVSLLHTLVQHTPADFMARQVRHEQRNEQGWTALEVAARERHVGPVWILLGEGHDEDDAQRYIQEFHDQLKQHHQNNNNNNNNNAKQQQQQPTAAASTASGENVKDIVDNNNNNDDQNNASDWKALEAQIAQQAASLSFTAHASDEQQQKQQALQLKQEGNQHFQKRDWSTALELYTSALALDPTNATLYSNRSVTYWKLQDYSLAWRDAVWAKTLQPEWPKAWYRLAVACLALHQYEEAALAAFEGLKRDSDNDELKQLVQTCVKQGRREFLSSSSSSQSSSNQHKHNKNKEKEDGTTNHQDDDDDDDDDDLPKF